MIGANQYFTPMYSIVIYVAPKPAAIIKMTSRLYKKAFAIIFIYDISYLHSLYVFKVFPTNFEIRGHLKRFLLK